jgi:hypothetical protein
MDQYEKRVRLGDPMPFDRSSENTCKPCLCSTCCWPGVDGPDHCPQPCKAMFPCDSPVTKCGDYQERP